MQAKTIFTIGHSTRPFDEFVSILQSFQIELLIDIRSFPGSKRHPQFNKAYLEATLPKNGINYLHLVDLGGRRKTSPASVNTNWQLPAFRGYADYMETDTFKNAIELLENEALQQRTVYMCSEALWWSCHRSLVSDYLKARGWQVLHIMKANVSQEHPYTKAARVVNGVLTYREPDLFS